MSLIDFLRTMYSQKKFKSHPKSHRTEFPNHIICDASSNPAMVRAIKEFKTAISKDWKLSGITIPDLYNGLYVVFYSKENKVLKMKKFLLYKEYKELVEWQAGEIKEWFEKNKIEI